MRTAFIGHRQIFCKDIKERITQTVKAQIRKGCKTFVMGTHGEFDELALFVCRQLRHEFNIEIEVVITSLHKIQRDCVHDYTPYSDVKTVMYDIEEAHFKQQITISNCKMIDTCDNLICYVNEKCGKSGAKTAMNYAKKKGLTIINLYD